MGNTKGGKRAETNPAHNRQRNAAGTEAETRAAPSAYNETHGAALGISVWGKTY